MAEEYNSNRIHEHETKPVDEGSVETSDRGLFDFLGKKKEEGKKPQGSNEEVIISHEFEKVEHVSEPEPLVHNQEYDEVVVEFDQKVKVSEKVEEDRKKEEEKKHGFMDKIHRSDSSSSSSSDEDEDGEGKEEKKKNKKEKKGLKEKIKEKISKDKEEDTTVPVEKYEEAEPVQQTEEKKGFLDKIKEKLPGHKKTDEVPPPAVSEPELAAAACEGEAASKEKKGIFDKIKEKLPGYHPKAEEDKEKEKEKECSHSH